MCAKPSPILDKFCMAQQRLADMQSIASAEDLLHPVVTPALSRSSQQGSCSPVQDQAYILGKCSLKACLMYVKVLYRLSIYQSIYRSGCHPRFIHM